MRDNEQILSDKLLHQFAERCGGYDRENRFFQEDFDDLRRAGYLTMGMRATRSDDTLLEGAFVPDKYIARIVPAGRADAFVLGIFAWALLGFGNIYYGIARRAIDLALPGIKGKTSLGLSRSMAYHPEIQHMVAEMALAFDPIGPHLDRVAEDWSNGVDHGAAWPSKIVSAKYHAIEACWRIVDKVMEVSGGAGMLRANEL